MSTPSQPAPGPCKHERMWFSRTIEEDGSMHEFCEACGKRDDKIAKEAWPVAGLEEAAREFQNANRPEPLKCMYCGKAQTFGPMASGAIWLERCSAGTSPDACHVYEITIGGDPEEYELKRLVEFTRQRERLVWLDLIAECDREGEAYEQRGVVSEHLRHIAHDWRVMASWLRAKAEGAE